MTAAELTERTEAGPMSMDDVFEILSNSRRRELIDILRVHAGPMALDDLADRIAAREHNTSVEAVERDQHRRVYISLYQTHLPKLVDHGVVSYDEDEKVLGLTERVGPLEEYLYPDEGRARPWYRYYGLLAIVAAGLTLASWFGALPVSAVLVAQLAAAGFVVLAALQYADTPSDRNSAA